MKPLVLIGGGGHCKACIDVIEQTEQFNIVGILDKPELLGEKVLGYNIIGSDDLIESLVQENNEFLITVGQIRTPQFRQELFNNLLKYKGRLAVVISPRAYVSKHAMVGAGSIIMHDALINAEVKIGQNCIINSKALIEHDVTIEDHCHISTAAVINGGVTVKPGSFVGSNAVTKESCTTPSNAFIKAGSLFLG